MIESPSDKVPAVKPTPTLIIFVLALLAAGPAVATESRVDRQAKLDATCETARQKKLTPMREQFVRECVANKELPGEKECTAFYADYGNRMGNRAALFYDLPACVTAFEYNQSSRSSN